jgi:hypothetical protein
VAVTVPDGSGMGGWSRQKIGNDVFRQGRYNICTLNSELKAKRAAVVAKWGQKCKTKNHKQLVICPQLKSVTFTKMAICLIAAYAANNSQSNVE